MATDPVHVGSYRPFSPARILPAHTTRPVFVFASADAGAGPPVTAGGSRLFALTAAQFQSTPAALSARLFAARRLTQVSAMGTAAITTNTITRTTGSFITDGWLVGDSIGFQGTTNLPVNADTPITAVSALTLTFAASSFTAETPVAPAAFWRLNLLATSTLPSGAGSTAGTAAVDIFTDAKPFMDASPNRALAVGPGSGYFAALLSTLPAAGYVDITPLAGDY